MFVSGLPSVAVLIGTWAYMEESPRYLIANEKYEQAFGVINRMIQKNNANPYKTPDVLNAQDKKDIIEWRN